MEGNPGRRLIAPMSRMCAVEAQRCVDCVSAVLRCLHAQRLSGRFTRQQAYLAFLDQMRPCGRSTYLSTTTTETLADSPSGSDWRMVQFVELEHHGAGA